MGKAIIIKGADFSQVAVASNTIPVTGLAITGASGSQTQRQVQLSVSYTPADTTQLGVVWSVVSGNATISSDGLLTYNGSTASASVVVKATSTKDSSVYAQATVSFALPAIEAPTFSPAQGTYVNALSVALSCGTAGATIYYTTDGSTPTSASSVYSSPITVTSDTTIKAIAIKNGESSNVATAAYVIAIPRTVTVNVTEDSSPLEGATVKLDDFSPVSSSGGSYVFGVADGTYTLTVQKAGYVSHSESCVVSGDKTVAVALNVRDLLANALVTNPNCMTSYGSHGSLYPCIIKTANPSGGSATAGAYISEINGRCGVAIQRSAAAEPIAWNTNTKANLASQSAAHQVYSLIEWPLDKDTITIKMTNSDYYILPCLTDKTQTSFDSESFGWVQGGANCEITLNRTTYPSLYYVALHMKYLSTGTTWQSVSIADLGLTVTAE